MKVDLTVLAIPAYLGAMGAEYAWQRRHPVPAGTRAGDYQTADTLASLSMGLGSLVAPYAAKKLLDPVTPGLGRYAKVLVGAGAAAGLATTVADVLARRSARRRPPPGRHRARARPRGPGRARRAPVRPTRSYPHAIGP